MMPRRPTLVQALARVLAELRAAENKAIDSGKPTMWAYYASMVDALTYATTQWDGSEHRVFGTGGDPNAVVRRQMHGLLRTPEVALENGYCFRTSHDQWRRAQAAALQVYATRVLRLAGERVPTRSLDWLRAEKRWSDPS